MLLQTDAEPHKNNVEQWGERIIFLETADSTNRIAKERAKMGDGQGTAVWAHRQTGGYGRLGRKWEAPAGGLWFSLILRPGKQIAGLPILFSLWTVQFIESQNAVSCAIHWPNDIYTGEKKLGGILLEGVAAKEDADSYSVAGIGLNVNNPMMQQQDFKATSLLEETGLEANLAYMLEDLLLHLQFNYETAQQRGFSAFQDEVNEKCPMRDKMVSITQEQQGGLFLVREIGPQGQLIVFDEAGRRKEFISCERVTML